MTPQHAARAPSRRGLPFSVVAKPTGAACNLDCTYCFFLSKDLLYDRDSQWMTDEALRTYVRRFLQAQPDGPVTMVWQGGEPTLRGLDFYRRAVELARRYARRGQDVTHALQTNGTLLDDEWGAFLAQEHFLVGLSVDGPARLHDAYRVNKGGRGTHAMVMRGWEVLVRHEVDTNILCTVNAANQDHPLEVYEFFRDELGARFLQFIPIVERVEAAQLPLAEQGWRPPHGSRTSRALLYRQAGTAVTSRSVDPAAWGSFLIAIFDEWVRHDIGNVYVQQVETMLSNLLGRYTLCVHAPECGGGLAVEHNGDVYSCDHYVEPGYKLGNIAEQTFPRMLASPFQREFGRSKRTALPRQCVECPVRWACHGGCPKDRFTSTADGQSGLNYLCAGYRGFFSHATPAVRMMAELLRNGRDPAEVRRFLR